MGRLIKILLTITLALIVLIVTALFVITRFIDPNEFKPEIEQQAKDNANLTLNIEGDLAWQFWPSLGVSLGRTEARIGEQSELFAALDNAAVSVAILPLLTGSVEMDGVQLSGLTINLEEGADGANWEKIGPPSASTEPAADDSSAAEESNDGESLSIPLSIPSVAITDSTLRYRNTQDGTDIVIEHVQLHATDVSLDQPFALQTSLRYQDQSDIRIDLNLLTQLGIELDQQRFSLSGLELDTTLAGIMSEPVTVRLEQDMVIDLNADSLTIENLLLQAVGTETRGELNITGLTGDLQLDGNLNTAPFNAKRVLERLGETAPETANPDALSRIALALNFGGEPGTIMIAPLTLTVDDSTLSGNAGLLDMAASHITFNLNLDSIALADYLPPVEDGAEQPAPSTTPAAQPSDTSSLSEAPLLPPDTLASLRPLRIDGKVSVGNATLENLVISDAQLHVDARNGLLRVTQLSANTAEGTLTANASLDIRDSTPKMSAEANITRMQISPFAIYALGDDLASGALTLRSRINTRGNSEKALMDNTRGQADLSLADATVRGLNLYHTLVGGVNDMLGEFQGLASQFIPGEESGKLPSALSEDTKILDLTTVARIERNVAHLDNLTATLRKGTISGTGWFDMLSQNFDTTIGMQSPELGSSRHLEGVTWPLRCNGNLSGDATRWCGPDKAGFRDIGKQVAANAAQEKIKEELGIDAEGDTVNEMVQDAARKKAKEEAERHLKDKLQGLFR